MGASRTPAPRALSRGYREREDSTFDLAEVPAAVVCTTCGLPDCNCDVDRPSAFSGVVAIVPWERPGGHWLSRLWATARFSTLSPEAFFSALPPGGALRPLVFACLAEGLAALGLCGTFGALALGFAPALAREIMDSAWLRQALLGGLAWGVPGLVLAMVLVHVAHGVALDAAARSAGSRALGRGIRFGLYACGWDLVTLPLGLLLLTFTDGPSTAVRHSARGLTAPNNAARAYLEHVHHCERDSAVRLARRAVLLVFFPTVALVATGFVTGLLLASR